MNMQLKAAPAHCFTVGKFVEFQHDDENYYDGKITTIVGSMACLEFQYFGDIETVTRGFNELRLVDQIAANWWSSIVDPLSEEVLGDREPDLTKIDAIGRGKKGFGHGSIDWKPITRKRKNGKIWKTSQPWYQWEDEKGKHCRYLRKGTDLVVQKLIDSGANVEAILDTIGQDKNERKRKTR